MEHILLIGKPNELLESLSSALSEQYTVQYGSEVPAALEGVLRITKPKTVVILMVGFTFEQDRIFEMLNETIPSIPVVTIGTNQEHKLFHAFETASRYVNLVRPITNQEVLDAVDECLYQLGDYKYENKKKKILVVDDDGMMLRRMNIILGKDYDVSVVNSGMKALTSMGKSTPDLIILDYDMPVCDGRMTLEMIRAEKEYKNIPVFFLTGVADGEHVKAVLELNPVDYLLKPLKPEILLDRVRTFFEAQK